MRLSRHAVIIAALLILLAGCRGDDDASKAAPATVLQSISVTPASVTLLTDETKQLTATATYSDGTTANVTSSVAWTSSASGVVSVTTPGLAKAVSAGKSIVQATTNGITGQASFTVDNAPATPAPPEPSDGWTITLFGPGADAVVPNKFVVSVAAKAPSAEISSVTAQVGAVSSELRFIGSAQCTGGVFPREPTPCWTVEMDISSLARGALQLQVTAKDALGNSASRTVPIVHDALPVINVSRPAQHALARPQLAIAASCSDDDPAGCTSLLAFACTSSEGGDCVNAFATGVATLDTTIDLAAYDGQRRYLTYIATDSRGQQSRASVPIYVETSPRLVNVAQVPGFIKDADADRILYVDEVAGEVRIFDRATSVDTLVSNGPVDINDKALLTPSGAVVTIRPALANRNLVSIEAGVAVDLGPVDADLTRRRGPFVAWSNGPTIMRRDVTSASTETVDTAAQGTFDVAADGTVSFANAANQIVLYGPAGATITVPTGSNGHPRTNGTDVVYSELALGIRLMLNRDGTPIELAPFSFSSTFPPDSDYQIAGDWLAYSKMGPSGVTQLWRMNPQNEATQVTFLNSRSQLGVLGANGSMTFTNSGRRYLSTAASTSSTDIGSALGGTHFIDGVPYILIGSTLLAIQ